jgi:hypothetical protein
MKAIWIVGCIVVLLPLAPVRPAHAQDTTMPTISQLLKPRNTGRRPRHPMVERPSDWRNSALARIGTANAIIGNQRKISQTAYPVPTGNDSQFGKPFYFSIYEKFFGTQSTGAGPVSP